MFIAQKTIVTTVLITDLFPTQMTVGIREVGIKRKRWRDAKTKEGREQILGSHRIPVVLGPRTHCYLIDRHHFTRALHDDGIKNLQVEIIDDLSMFEEDMFWTLLDNRGWMHPFNDAGQRRRYIDLPKSVGDLIDDPFRSLASELRRAGGYTKIAEPFSEFRWANFLRLRVNRAVVEDNFGEAMRLALKFANSPEAASLPGWLGARKASGLDHYQKSVGVSLVAA